MTASIFANIASSELVSAVYSNTHTHAPTRARTYARTHAHTHTHTHTRHTHTHSEFLLAGRQFTRCCSKAPEFPLAAFMTDLNVWTKHSALPLIHGQYGVEKLWLRKFAFIQFQNSFSHVNCSPLSLHVCSGNTCWAKNYRTNSSFLTNWIVSIVGPYFCPFAVSIDSEWEHVSYKRLALSVCMHCHCLVGHSHGWNCTVRSSYCTLCHRWHLVVSCFCYSFGTVSRFHRQFR